MTNGSAELIRTAYQAYARGDVVAMLDYVDPDLEWTYLDPSAENPEPEVCPRQGGARGGPSAPGESRLEVKA